MSTDKLHQKLAIIGHIDHEKSTLVGHLLYETRNALEHVIEQHRDEAEEKGKGRFEFASVMDNLAEERERGVTIETIDKKIDPSSDEVAEQNPDSIQSGDAAVVTVRPQKPLSIEPSAEIPELGSFAVRDMNQTIAAGNVLEVTVRDE